MKLLTYFKSILKKTGNLKYRLVFGGLIHRLRLHHSRAWALLLVIFVATSCSQKGGTGVDNGPDPIGGATIDTPDAEGLINLFFAPFTTVRDSNLITPTETSATLETIAGLAVSPLQIGLCIQSVDVSDNVGIFASGEVASQTLLIANRSLSSIIKLLKAPAGPIQMISLNLSSNVSGCRSQGSLVVTNSFGQFAFRGDAALKFVGSSAVLNGESTDIRLSTQEIADYLVNINSDESLNRFINQFVGSILE